MEQRIGLAITTHVGEEFGKQDRQLGCSLGGDRLTQPDRQRQLSSLTRRPRRDDHIVAVEGDAGGQLHRREGDRVGARGVDRAIESVEQPSSEMSAAQSAHLLQPGGTDHSIGDFDAGHAGDADVDERDEPMLLQRDHHVGAGQTFDHLDVDAGSERHEIEGVELGRCQRIDHGAETRQRRAGEAQFAMLAPHTTRPDERARADRCVDQLDERCGGTADEACQRTDDPRLDRPAEDHRREFRHRGIVEVGEFDHVESRRHGCERCRQLRPSARDQHQRHAPIGHTCERHRRRVVDVGRVVDDDRCRALAGCDEQRRDGPRQSIHVQRRSVADIRPHEWHQRRQFDRCARPVTAHHDRNPDTCGDRACELGCSRCRSAAHDDAPHRRIGQRGERVRSDVTTPDELEGLGRRRRHVVIVGSPVTREDTQLRPTL